MLSAAMDYSNLDNYMQHVKSLKECGQKADREGDYEISVGCYGKALQILYIYISCFLELKISELTL